MRVSDCCRSLGKISHLCAGRYVVLAGPIIWRMYFRHDQARPGVRSTYSDEEKARQSGLLISNLLGPGRSSYTPPSIIFIE